MTTTATFKDFTQGQLWRNKFLRPGERSIWDANIRHGDVRPFACPEVLCKDTGDICTIYSLEDCVCYGMEPVTDIVQGYCNHQHFYIGEERTLLQATDTELCDGVSPCKAGAPFQKEAPVTTSGCTDEDCDSVGVTYVITYITEHSGVVVESAPSPASMPVASSGHIPNATVTWVAGPDDYCITETRLYRAEVSFEDGTNSIPSDTSEYVLVATFPGNSGGQFFDNVPTDQTGYPLTTYEPMAFPAPTNLIGLARTDDGIVVADEHRVYISEAGTPQFTWDGVVEVEDEIIAIRTIGNTIFVFTNRFPVKIGYRHSDNGFIIDKQVVSRRLPLSSIKSLSVYDGKVYFATTHSLYTWDTNGYGSDIRPVLTKMLTPEQWKNLDPETITGVGYEFGYIFSSDAIDYSIMVEVEGDGTDTTAKGHIMPISYINPQAFGLDHDGHILYQQDGDMYRWDWRRETCDNYHIDDHVLPTLCDRCDCCPWSIKLYIDNEGKNRFSKMRVEFDERTDSVSVDFSLESFRWENKIATKLEVIKSRGFSIPKFCSSQTFCAELTGCGIMHEVRFGTSSQELVNSSNNQLE